MSKILPSRDIKRIRSIQDTITQATQETPEPSSPGLINSAKQVIFSTDAEDVPQVVEKEKSKKRLKKLQEELDDIICSECLLCGDAMIKSIDHPFVSEEEINAGSDWFL
jgi:hypothetical protein